MQTTHDLLAAHPFLAGMAPPHLDVLAHWATRTPLRPDSRIFAEGGKANGFWLLRDGYVNLDLHVPGRGTVVIDTLGPGGVLGWSWFFPPYRWHFGAVTDGPVLTVAFDGSGVRASCEANPVFGYELTKRFLDVVVKRMQASRTRLQDNQLDSTEATSSAMDRSSSVGTTHTATGAPSGEMTGDPAALR